MDKSTTAPVRFCAFCGQPLGASSVSVPPFAGWFHLTRECLPLTAEQGRMLAEAPIVFDDDEPGETRQ